jgi:calcium/calmodulin-dependent protein kinase I
LKLENLLLENHQDSAAVKVADFGFAKHTTTENLLTQCGSPLYVAPEIISKHPYGKPADMWAVGVITFILLGGYPPFQDDGKQSILFANIKAGNFQFDKEYWAHISEDAKNLISGLLQVNSSSRLTVYQTLAHPWVRIYVLRCFVVSSETCMRCSCPGQMEIWLLTISVST